MTKAKPKKKAAKAKPPAARAVKAKEIPPPIGELLAGVARDVVHFETTVARLLREIDDNRLPEAMETVGVLRKELQARGHVI